MIDEADRADTRMMGIVHGALRRGDPAGAGRPWPLRAGVWSLCTDQNALGGDGCA